MILFADDSIAYPQHHLIQILHPDNNFKKAMFFHTMKASYLQENPQQLSPTQKLLPLCPAFHKILKTINQLSLTIFTPNSTFLTNYLTKFFRSENEELALSANKFGCLLKVMNLRVSQIKKCLDYWLNDENSPVTKLIDIWGPYIFSQIEEVDNAHGFLSRELELFVKLIVRLIQEIYPQVDNSEIKTWFQFKLRNCISKEGAFSKVMKIYVQKFDKDKGVDAQFTTSQIQESVKELNELVSFAHIAEPFSRSIHHMALFEKEYRLRKKIMYLVEAVNVAKEEIAEYREEFKLGTAAIGSDQLCPIINYICEKTGKNILAAVDYAQVFLGPNQQKCERLLKEISEDAYYCLKLVEAVSRVYCHASQFLMN